MNTITKPMLAGKCEQPEALNFPVLATPKLDGIRCLKIGGLALTRSFKPISNRFAREWIEANLPDGVDGELMLRGGTFNATTSAIGRESGELDFVFHVFDLVAEGMVVPSAETYRKVTCLARRLGIRWSHNVLRHSFISYRIAKVKNANEVALEAGNSPAVIFKHYRELATEAQADAWFAIRPEPPVIT